MLPCGLWPVACFSSRSPIGASRSDREPILRHPPVPHRPRLRLHVPVQELHAALRQLVERRAARGARVELHVERRGRAALPRGDVEALELRARRKDVDRGGAQRVARHAEGEVRVDLAAAALHREVVVRLHRLVDPRALHDLVLVEVGVERGLHLVAGEVLQADAVRVHLADLRAQRVGVHERLDRNPPRRADAGAERHDPGAIVHAPRLAVVEREVGLLAEAHELTVAVHHRDARGLGRGIHEAVVGEPLRIDAPALGAGRGAHALAPRARVERAVVGAALAAIAVHPAAERGELGVGKS